MADHAVYDHVDCTAVIAAALREDLRGGSDLTCDALVPPTARLEGLIRAKQSGVVCGLPAFRRVFAILGGGVGIHFEVPDGTAVRTGEVVLRFSGPARTLLVGERTALNLAQRLSGTATLTRRYVDAIAGTRASILDTRKTTPGLRILEKHAVVMGGGVNHRLGLYDAVLIKENHIALMDADTKCSSPAEAVRRARASIGPAVMIEVEIESLDDLEPVIVAGANIVLLDNMWPDDIRAAVTRRDKALKKQPGRRVLLEASGGINLHTVRSFAETGVDRISVGALTHSVPALDLSMRCEPVSGH
ncbi:MAG: carboxylating nicotinate-nucleotide diphosphorylase [Planctomycetota bacterium]